MQIIRNIMVQHLDRPRFTTTIINLFIKKLNFLRSALFAKIVKMN